MKENYDNVVKQYKSRPLTPEEVKELTVNSIKRVEPLLRALREWCEFYKEGRAHSLHVRLMESRIS